MQTRYQSIFETSLDGIILITDRGVIEDINKSALELFGYEKDELMGQNIKILMPEPHRSDHPGHLKRYKETREARVIGIGRELEGMRKDKTLFPFQLAVSEFESSGHVFYAGAIRDLTEKKMQEKIIEGYSEELEQRVLDRTKKLEREVLLRESAQKALMESTRLFEIIAQNFPNGTIYVLDKKLEIIYVEGSDLRKRGVNPDSLRGKNYLFNASIHQKKELELKLLDVFKGKSITFEYTSGNLIYRLRGVLISNEDNEQILVVENNITKQKQAEEEVYENLEKERNLSELKTNFVSMASHEFRTPLSSILSSASLVERYTDSDQQNNRAKHIAKIRANVKNLTMILNDFLSIEKIETGLINYNPVQINIDIFFQSLIEDLDLGLKENQTIKIENNLDKDTIYSDDFLLQNVLINLLSNAIKYSSDDVILRIEDVEGIQIVVQDQGIGISEQDQSQLFERFFRASNVGQIQGVGLGPRIQCQRFCYFLL
jgi:PAS domain S-box-containing protein